MYNLLGSCAQFWVLGRMRLSYGKALISSEDPTTEYMPAEFVAFVLRMHKKYKFAESKISDQRLGYEGAAIKSIKGTLKHYK